MFENSIITNAASLFSRGTFSTSFLGGFYNNVYKIMYEDKELILKLYRNKEVSVERIQSEIEWVNFLGHNQLPISKAIPSLSGSIIEAIESDSDTYIVTAFEVAKGENITKKSPLEWSDQLLVKWGEFMGSMHKMSNIFTTNFPDYRRSSWLDDELIRNTNIIEDSQMKTKWVLYIGRLKELQNDSGCFGLIHNDLHPGNFVVTQDGLTVFDFGDSEFSWFAYDIAISLHHSVDLIPTKGASRRNLFARRFLRNFLKGYQKEKEISKEWLEKILFFLDFRQCYSYLYLTKNLNYNELTDSQKNYLNRKRKNIIDGVPFIEIETSVII